MTYKKDNNDLLYYLLQTIVRENITYLSNKRNRDEGIPNRVDIEIDDFESRVKIKNKIKKIYFILIFIIYYLLKKRHVKWILLI